MTTISGSVAVVTGGASGIGRGIAEALLAADARVVIADISADEAASTAGDLGATWAMVDVSDPVSVHQLATATREQHGRADIVVNNAGVGPQGAIADLTAADWRWLIDVNLFGVIHGIEAFLPLLRSSPTGGHIVNTASMSAFAPMVGLGAYAASKSAVAALTEVLAAELAESDPSIGVTLLAPGSVRTGIAESLRHRPESAGGGLRNIDFQQIAPPSTGTVWLEPREVGDMVVRAISDNEPYVITHPGLWGRVEARHGRLRSAFEAHPAHPGLPD